MDTFIARAGRWPLALMLWALAALATACSDETLAPKPASTPKPGTPSLAIGEIQVTVTNASGGNDVGSLQWAVSQVNEPGPTTGVIVFDPSLDGATITLDAALQAQRPVEIRGPAKGITLSGNDQHRVVDGGTSLSLRNLTLMKGYADLGSAVMAPSLVMYNTTVQGNRGAGSAVYANNNLQVVNSTVSGNVVGQPAVQYGPYAYVTLDNSTIAYNAPGAGFGPAGYPQSMQITLRNSILANNGSQQNCSSFFGFNYQGKNISSDWSCGEVGITVTDPQLLPLAKNGGPNMTHAIPFTSPAFNAGVACTEATDQRYVARDAKCDVGAFEFNDFTKVILTIDQAVKFNSTTKKALLTGTIRCTRNEAFRLALELHQNQKVGGQVVDIHSASDIPVACTTSARPWSATMGLGAGQAFQSGAAQATVVTFQTAEWVTPASLASAVKISVARK